MKKEILYISNLLSLSRFLLVAVTAWFLLEENYLLGCLLIVVIWISDLLDGYLARKRNEVSEIGKIIDPIADKTAIAGIAIIMLIQGLIPFWFVIITFSRDALILLGGLYLNAKKNIVLQSNVMGKLAVFIIGSTLFLSIFEAGAQKGQFGFFFSYHNEITELLIGVLLFSSIVMIILSLVFYGKRFFEVIKT